MKRITTAAVMIGVAPAAALAIAETVPVVDNHPAIHDMEDWEDEKHKWTDPICIGGTLMNITHEPISRKYLQIHSVVFRFH